MPVVPLGAGQPFCRPETKVSQHSGQRSRVLQGKKVTSADNGVKGIPRRLHAFVSRLEAGTTEQQLAAWLAGVGILGATCSLIVPKDGRTFRTVAFRVSCDAQYANLFYDEASWPAGCELRDWVFKVSNVQHVENVSA